jgi:hypothetical protein
MLKRKGAVHGTIQMRFRFCFTSFQGDDTPDEKGGIIFKELSTPSLTPAESTTPIASTPNRRKETP